MINDGDSDYEDDEDEEDGRETCDQTRFVPLKKHALEGLREDLEDFVEKIVKKDAFLEEKVFGF